VGLLARGGGQEAVADAVLSIGLKAQFSSTIFVCWGGSCSLLALPAQIALADEGGVSFCLPGFFGSLAAVPAQTLGWSTSIY
jgi:hypothetical protein